MVLPLIVCVRGKGTHIIIIFQSRRLVRMKKRGQESRRLLRCNSCPCGVVGYLVHYKARDALRQGLPPWLIPLHHSIILQCLHLKSGSSSHSMFTDVKPFRQTCLQDICHILSYSTTKYSAGLKK